MLNTLDASAIPLVLGTINLYWEASLNPSPCLLMTDLISKLCRYSGACPVTVHLCTKVRIL